MYEKIFLIDPSTLSHPKNFSSGNPIWNVDNDERTINYYFANEHQFLTEGKPPKTFVDISV